MSPAHPTRPDRLPALFLSHGSPMLAMNPRAAGTWMQGAARAWTERFGTPRAIVVASAHTLTREPVLLAAQQHAAVYDFGGFDEALYRLRYDVAGAPTALVDRVEGLVRGAGLPVHRVDSGGLDHGIWTPLRWMWPQADVPVLPLGWPPNWSPRQLYALGEALAPLAHDGVLVLGSGAITHNLRRVFTAHGMTPVDSPATTESQAFRDWFAQAVAEGNWPDLFNYRRQAPHAALMHPSDEHLLPFFVAAGAGRAALDGGQRVHASFEHADLGMDAYAFGSTPEAREALAL